MAGTACLITITGTSGLVAIDYKLFGEAKTIQTGPGTIYIDSDATDVVYTTIFGDAAASSGCLTISSGTPNCYLLGWNGLTVNPAFGYTITDLILGTEYHSLGNIPFPASGTELATAINNLYLNEVKVIAKKTVPSTSTNQSYLLKVIGTRIPLLQVADPANQNFIHFLGQIKSDCLLPSGYEEIVPCYGVAPVPSSSRTPDCHTWSGTVTAANLADATGNSDSNNDGVVILRYIPCNETQPYDQYFTAENLSITTSCIDYTPTLFYYNNDTLMDISSQFTQIASC